MKEAVLSRVYRVALEHALDELETWIVFEELGQGGPTENSRRYRLLHADIREDLTWAECLTKLLDIANLEIAEAFDVSLPTVKRWKAGTSRPYPAMYEAVRDWLKKRKRT